MSRHPIETDLALFISSDLGLWKRAKVNLHASGCEQCRARIHGYRMDRERRRQEVAEMPPGLDWNRLAAEMTANIHVGLAAGECVAPRGRKPIAWGWRPAALMAGVAVVLAGAWWLNLAASDTESLQRAMTALWNGRANTPVEDRGPVVATSASGIELREKGGSLAISQGTSMPVAITVSAPGSASARYVDADTGQMTITSVYVQ